MNEEQLFYDLMKKFRPDLWYINLAINGLKETNNSGGLGKIYAEANEYIQRDWINNNTNLQVIKREDLATDINQSGFDLITHDGLLKIQSKLRYKDIHLEQTRRVSEKNLNNSETGHVSYSVGEADLYLISKPKSFESYNDYNDWEYIAIPEFELINPKKPNSLVTRVPMKIARKYYGKAVETIKECYNTKKLSANNE